MGLVSPPILKMLRLLVAVVLVAGAHSLNDIPSRTMTKLHHYNLCAQCWGEEYADEYQLGILAATEKCASTPSTEEMAEEARLLTEEVSDDEDVETSTAAASEYITPEDLMEFRGVTMNLVNNFTCVMKELSFLTADGEINSEIFAYSEELQYADQVHFTSGDRAGSDPIFMKKLTTDIGDCAALSKSFPQQTLDRNPFMKKYGRMAIYFKCIKDVERNLCGKYLLTRAFERFGVPIDATGFEDKYDAALFCCWSHGTGFHPGGEAHR